MQTPQYSSAFEPVARATGFVTTIGANAIKNLLSIAVPSALFAETALSQPIYTVGLIKICVMAKIYGGANDGLSIVGQGLVTVKLSPAGVVSLPKAEFPINGDETAPTGTPVGGLAPSLTGTNNIVTFTVQNSTEANERIDWVGQAELIVF